MLGDFLACPNDMGADHGPVNRSPYPAALVQPPYSGPTAGQLARGFSSLFPRALSFARVAHHVAAPKLTGGAGSARTPPSFLLSNFPSPAGGGLFRGVTHDNL